MPAYTPDFSNPLSSKVYILADKWIEIFRENANVSQPAGDMEVCEIITSFTKTNIYQYPIF